MSEGQTTTGLRALLSSPRVYETWSQLVSGPDARPRMVRELIRPKAGDRVLDVGCGTGDWLSHLGDVTYVGVDLSASYIDSARKRFDGHPSATFLVGDAAHLPEDLGRFDLAMVTGVLHHLTDDDARAMVDAVAAALKPDGRFVALENTYVEGQSRIARAIIDRDRGDHVRTPAGYEALATAFGEVRTVVRHDLLRIPYTHCILECTQPRTA